MMAVSGTAIWHRRRMRLDSPQQARTTRRPARAVVKLRRHQWL